MPSQPRHQTKAALFTVQALTPHTRELALICDDPDAPTPEPWVHWVIYGISPDVASLPEGIPNVERPAEPTGALQGKNSWTTGKTIGYRGPAPPAGHGTHHYRFTLYALGKVLEIPAGVNKAMIYYRIGDKKALYAKVLHEVIGDTAERIACNIKEDQSPEEKFNSSCLACRFRVRPFLAIVHFFLRFH